MRTAEKRKVLFSTVIIGLICILIVVLTAYCAELRCENNDLMKSNETIQGEIDTLNVKIKSANNIEHIEYVATRKLGMIYPTDEECIYVSQEDPADRNLASTIKEQAYN